MTTSNPAQAAGAASGFRLPDQARIGTVRLRVADLARSLAFYTDVLGFHATRGEGGVATLSAGEGGPVLVELHERPGARPAPRRGAVGLYHFAVLVPSRAELGRVLARIRASGWGGLGASDHLVSEALYLSDPDGNGVEVYRDRPRSEWRMNGDELSMATVPLDLAALLRDAAPAGDGRLAAGTTIGHVHLHVASLEGADAFLRGALGMDLRVWSYPGALFFAAGGYHHHVGTNVWAGPDAPRAGEDDAGLIDWELLVPARADADAVAASLRERGFAPEEIDGGWGVVDPSGIALRVRAG